jgi:hypothetical protein
MVTEIQKVTITLIKEKSCDINQCVAMLNTARNPNISPGYLISPE